MESMEKTSKMESLDQSKLKKKKLSDDAVDGIAAIVIITLVVSAVVYWLETMT